MSDVVCPKCEGLGLVVSEDDIEAVAERLCEERDGGLSHHPDRKVCSFNRMLARAAVTTLIERWRTK